MDCFHCKSSILVVKDGFYHRPSDRKQVQRYLCRECGKRFSDHTLRFDYRLRKRRINQMLFRLLAKGVSQRGCADVLELRRAAVDLRVVRFGIAAMARMQEYRKTRQKVKTLLIDEMETFEHSKCKPVTIAIAVEEKTRKILYLKAGAIAAKGKLAEISRKKYGIRKCQRRHVLDQTFATLSPVCESKVLIKSDESRHYPRRIRRTFPEGTHLAFKGRRGCVVGQGELKEGDFDPLFYLNHTYAMIRDNTKRLSRRTWCTTKSILKLEYLINIYAWCHNQRLDKIRPLIA